MKMNYKLFLILKDKQPLHAFIEKNYEQAKMYFYGYLVGEEFQKFKLMQIGTFEEGKLITNHIFITGGYECNAEMKNKRNRATQIKLNFTLNKKKFEDVIKDEFEGTYER